MIKTTFIINNNSILMSINLEFQLYDYLEDHTVIENEEEDEDELPGEFIIHSFGRCMDGKSVYAKITGFTPYFYFLIPNNLQNKPKEYLEDVIKKMDNFFKGKDNKKVFKKFKLTLKEVQLIKLKIAEGFTNDREQYFARLIFNNADGMKKYRYYLENNDVYIYSVPELARGVRFKLYEANLPPMLRCFHIREISGCSWVSTSSYDLIDEDKETHCDIEIHVDWRQLNPIKKEQNAPLRICSMDIECNSIDGEFPQAKRPGDAVIQIGCTYTKLGESTPYRQYIACLKETSKLDNIVVESFNTEQELMLAFLNEITTNDCDIITGYNTFFFDEKYMFDRCKNILNLEAEMSYMSKIKSFKCKFKEMKLASSALGENLLRFWDTPGRVHIDLMKDIQKTFNLPSYKLDYVASKFIRGEVLSYMPLENDTFELSCKAVNDINIGDYIHLEVIKGFVSDEVGEKYIVLHINMSEKKIIVKGDIMLANELDSAKLGGTIYWSQAKDDVGPKDIFRLQKGSPDDRGIVAKYCVKDCKLVNLLINKLEVVTKNIEMANVCYVPLSYLFIRGQGIKLFSLCLKEFRKQKYAFPVLKLDKLYRCTRCECEYLNKWACPKCNCKERDEIESESTGYEGAIVFDPVPKVDYEALATKDYMSLYPASIMHKNMSHETIVEDSDYDNLPGIKYYNANFRESDGSIQYRRFAQLGDKLGVIPTILSNLLKERKAIKKLMGVEKDPFKYRILDAKQLAVKVTANSLYGQLGAATSPVCKRDIAACTTSTGREMLILAKKYDEESLPWIINGLKYFYENNMLDKVEQMYDMELKARTDDKFISELKEYITKDLKDITFQPVIRYGDSVIGSTPLLLRNTQTGIIFIESINNLSKDYRLMERELNDQYKESSELQDIETWTEKGWTKVHRVIRHKLSKDKKLFRITTHSGSVVVTDDHSLLTCEGKEISSKNLKIGDKLLHSFPEINNNKDYIFYNGIKLNVEIAQFLGIFMGDGSCGYYNCPSGKKASFAINNKNIEIITKYKNIGNKYFTDFEWVQLDTLKSSNVYKLVPKIISTNTDTHYGKIKNFVCEIRKLMYTYDSQKKVPEFILNATKEIREAFFIGLYDADGFKTNTGKISKDLYNKNLSKPITDKIRCGTQIDQKGMISSLGIYTLGKSLGYQVSINNRTDKINIYRMRFSEKLRKDPNIIKKIEEWKEPEEYVYDLTTTNHHFQAGVGSLIVHNTDSIFSCYRFRENTKPVNKIESLKIWKNVIKFARELILPYFGKKEQELFNDIFNKYYNDNMIVDLTLPKGPITIPHSSHNMIILPLEERMKQFITEYMQESYLPWLWTLAELVEKNYHETMFDIKLNTWADHQLGKIRLTAENLTENRKNIIMKPIVEELETIFPSKYTMPSDSIIGTFAKKLLLYTNLEEKQLLKLTTQFMEKTIKEKWIYSSESKEITKIIKKYLNDTIDDYTDKNFDKMKYYLIDFMSSNKNFDINKMTELLNKNLLADIELGYTFNQTNLESKTKDFIESYIKHNGKKTLEELVEDFLTKELSVNFNLDKDTHYNMVINFIKNNMRKLDMSTMEETDRYSYYWIQPRWDFNNKDTLYCVDIYEGGESITDKRSLDYAMKMGIMSGELIKSRLPFPHDCEYEKTFWPFAILTKKRYVGNKYEFDPNKYKQDFMGIVLKRRDNAAIVKEICGGIIDYLINKKSPSGAKEYTRKCLQNMFDGKYDIKYFLQSRTLKLKESYKDWTRIAHVYLAEKIAKRDPGSVPQSGDRIEFAVIKVPPPALGVKLLQGDIIETPQFIKQNNLEIDYLFYLTNQIMNPALQFLELVDKKAINIFNEFITKYSAPKIPKVPKIPKILKEKPEKPEKIPKIPKIPKVPKEKPEKPIKLNKKKNALDLLMEAKINKSKPKSKNLLLDIQKLMDEINESIEKAKPEKIDTNMFIEL